MFDALEPFDLDENPFENEAEASGTTKNNDLPFLVPKRQSHSAQEGPKPIQSAPLFDQDEPLFFPLNLERDIEKLGLVLSNEQKARLEARSWTSGTGKRFRPLGTL